MRLVLISSLLAACANPTPIATEACMALPGLSTDPAGLALLTPLLINAEGELLAAATPTLGLEKVGAEGLAALREKAVCELVAVNNAGSGRWKVELKRSLPTVQADGSLGRTDETALEWQVVDEDGLRVETGLGVAAEMRASIAGAIAEDDLRRAASTWRALYRSYPDPVLPVDIAVAEAAEARAALKRRVKAVVGTPKRGKLPLEVTNRNSADVVGVELKIEFDLGDPVTVTVEQIPTKATEAISVEMPKGATAPTRVNVIAASPAEDGG